jgi:hypothetical protein
MSFDSTPPPPPPPGPEQGPYYEYNPYPQNPYGAPQEGYQPYGVPVAPAAPLPLGEAINQLPRQYWKAVTKPGAMTFAEESGKAKWDIILTQLFGYAIIVAILALINYYVTAATTAAILNQLNSSANTTSTTGTFAVASSPGGALLISLAETLIGFFIIQGILFGLAKAFGGQGTFAGQAYSFLLFQVPLGILTGVLDLIPIAGAFIGLAVLIYEIVLSVFAIQGTHRLSGGKASAVVLIPVAVALLLFCIGVFIIAAAAINKANAQ